MKILAWARTQWDRVTAWVLIGIGTLAVFIGWNGVSSEPLTAKQIPYVVSGGIGGLLLTTIGAMLWLSADLRDEWRKLDSIERELSASRATQDQFGPPFEATADHDADQLGRPAREDAVIAPAFEPPDGAASVGNGAGSNPEVTLAAQARRRERPLRKS